MNETAPPTSKREPRYALIFLVLIALTVLEILVAPAAFARGWLNAMLMAMAFVKAGVVAAYYMHLRGDPRIYTWILVLPVLLLLVFSMLSVVI